MNRAYIEAGLWMGAALLLTLAVEYSFARRVAVERTAIPDAIRKAFDGD